MLVQFELLPGSLLLTYKLLEHLDRFIENFSELPASSHFFESTSVGVGYKRRFSQVLKVSFEFINCAKIINCLFKSGTGVLYLLLG